MKYTRIPVNTFKRLQLNAGILSKDFDPETGEVKEEDLFGATNGGINFKAVPSTSNFADGIDNAPSNVKEFINLEYYDVSMDGNFVSVGLDTAKTLIAAADVDKETPYKIVPRSDLKDEDFQDLWWIGDYSDINEDGTEGGNAGFIAIHMLNSLNTGGFQLQSGNRDKGQFAFSFKGHYSLEDQSRVPFEVYVREGEVGGEE